MTSTRLPGKVLHEVLGRPLLFYHLSRLRKSRHIDALVVATTVNAADDPIVDYCAAEGFKIFRGDEQDVLSRYEGAVQAFGGCAETVVRVTSDCPLIDAEVIDGAIDFYLAGQPELDYVAVDGTRFPHGLDAEIFRRSALAAAATEATDPAEREHVTPFIYRRQPRFRCGSYTIDEAHGHNRWCVDEPADFELVRRMLEALVPQNPDFGWRDAIRLLDQNPDWRDINGRVEQKQSADILLRSGVKNPEKR